MTAILESLRRFNAGIDREKWLALFKHAIPFVVFLFAVWLFQHQISDNAHYPADTRWHIKFAVAGVGYSLMTLALNGLVKAFGSHSSWAIAVFEALMVVGAYYPMAAMCRKILKNDWIACVVSGVLLFWGGIYLPVVRPWFYYGAFVTQPWHNITYIGMRLFATWTIYWLFDILSRYEGRFSALDWTKVAVSLVLATAIKPNFLLAFSVSLALFLAIRVCAGKFALRSMAAALKLGTVVLPSIAILYVQSRILYGGGGDGGPGVQGGIAFVGMSSPFFVSGAKHFFWACAQSLTLAALVWVFHCRKGMGLTAGEQFLALQELAGVFFFVFFMETGPRANDGNFGWTAFVTGYLVYGAVVSRFVRDLMERHPGESWRQGRYGRVAYQVAGLVLLAAHITCGFIYFTYLLNARFYLF